jgi:alkanesulfonate monooxygenase SsuD/methylene tetrahydromethanopterin reductase-like flavin-dependent oxidoreductase (luciferase family)
MHVGTGIVYQAIGAGRTDREVYQRELALADLAEPLGYDSLWGVEHHFTDYTMCPDVLQHLTYFAGRTARIQLGSMVVVLPWHDPVRVAEQVAMLDHMSNGRFLLGIGRGLGRVEFEGFGVNQGDSREIFTESAQMLLEGLERGVVEFSGQHVQQARREIRPRPFKSFRGRTYAAAVSPESSELMARLGVGILIVPQKPWPHVIRELKAYREIYREVNHAEPPPPLVSGWVFMDDDESVAKELAHEYIGRYYRSVVEHYELAGTHLQGLKGYEMYGKIQEKMGAPGGVEAGVEFFTSLHPWGTPKQVYEKIMELRSMTGCEGFIGMFSYGGMPYDVAEQQCKRFAAELMPRLKAVVPVAEQQVARTRPALAGDGIVARA